MSLLDLITGSAGNHVADKAQNQFGISRNQIIALMAVATPLVVSYLKNKAKDKAEAESLNNALDKDHDGSILSEPSQIESRTQEGNSILDHIFGGQKAQVENELSQNTGISMDKIGPILGMLAPLIMGYIGKEKRSNQVQSGGISDLLGGLLGQAQQEAQGSSPLNDILGQVLRSGNQNQTSNPLQDLLGGMTGQSQSNNQGGLGGLLGSILGGR